MEIHAHSRQPCDSENDPGQACRKERETQPSKPSGGDPIHDSQHNIRVAKGQKRRCQKTDGQDAYDDLEPQRHRGIIPRRRKLPGLVEEKMKQKQHRLKKRDEAYESCSYPHLLLDSSSPKNGIHLLRNAVRQRAFPGGAAVLFRDNVGQPLASGTIAWLRTALQPTCPVGATSKW